MVSATSVVSREARGAAGLPESGSGEKSVGVEVINKPGSDLPPAGDTTTPGGTLCLEGDQAPDFAYRVTTQPCNAANNQAQQWEFRGQGGGVVKLVNRAISGWCIEANRIGDGSPIQLMRSSRAPFPRWKRATGSTGLPEPFLARRK